MGLGPKQVAQFLAAGLVKDPADFFALTKEDLTALDRQGETSATNLLTRLERYPEAVQISVEYLPEASLQLCQLAGDYTKLRDLSQQRDDIVGFTAGLLQAAE